MTEKDIRDILNTPEALEEIVTYVFMKIDTDGSGEIEIDEIEDLMLAFAQKIGGIMPDREEVRKMMNSIDKNGDGLIQKDELKVMVVEIMKSMTEKD